MQATLSDIVDRNQFFPGAVRGLADFTLANGSEVLPETVLASPDWSLYCIDVETEQALFVELPPGTDLAAAAFVYMTQFDLAKRAIVLPLDLLEPLSEQVALPENFGILFSTGRCGSTLASRILAQIPEVWSLSEPDVLENLAFARFALPQELMIPLIRAATRLLYRPPEGRRISTFVIKPRAESVVQAPEFALALPQSRNVFMYRDAEGFVDSLYKFAQKLTGEAFNKPEFHELAWRLSSVNAPSALWHDYFPGRDDRLDHAPRMTLGWVLRIDAYLAALDKGIRMHPIHYHDLNTNRRAETVRLMAAFGIALDHLDLAMRAFEKDSQEGSGGERDKPATPLSEKQRQDLYADLARWGKLDYRSERLPSGG